jgi:lipopolysaccharide export system protein LptA
MLILPPRARLLLLASSVALSQPAMAAGDLDTILERMEPGSVIKNLLIPRYDQEKQPTTVMRADRMVIETQRRFRAENLSLHLIKMADNPSLDSTWFSIQRCYYELPTSLLHSEDPVQVVSPQCIMQSQGLITRVERGQSDYSAFLHPPVTGYLNPNSPSPEVMKRTRQSLMLATMIAAQASADPTANPQPSGEEAFFAITPRSQEIDARLKEFAKEHQVQITPLAKPAQQLSQLQSVNPVDVMPSFVPQEDALGFACKGGVFFDSKTDSLTMLREVTIRNPSYAMTVLGEVKVLFEEKKEEKKIDKKKPEKPQVAEDNINDAENDKKPSGSSVGRIKQIVGTGGVSIEATDAKGVKSYASGDSVVYEMAKDELYLRGKKLIFQQGTESRFESANPNAWLRYNQKTKDFTMSHGWNARLTMPQQSKKPS